jgi:hypothetical protein
MRQKMMAMNPAVIQAQAKGRLQQQQHQNQQELIDQKDVNRAVVLGLRSGIESEIRSEAETGQGGAEGLGAGGTE